MLFRSSSVRQTSQFSATLLKEELLSYRFLRSSPMVRSTRFELVRSRALDPKSSVAAFTPAPQIVTAIYIHRAVSPISVSFASI